jgi:hypothetical protein
MELEAMTFAEMVTSSVLARALALFILALVMIIAALVGGYDFFIGRTIPPEVVTIVGGGIGFAFAIVGVNYGVVLQPMTAKKAPAPASPDPQPPTP